MGTLLRVLAFSGVVLAVSTAMAASAKEGTLSEYLFSQKLTSKEVAEGCAIDPLGFAGTEYVIQAIAGLTFADVDIAFVGCPEVPFKTGGGLKDLRTKRRAFVIYYPVSVEGRTLESWEYVAPIVHEISHVYQINLAGSLGELRSQYCIERIELGADFTTGFLFKTALGIAEKRHFQQSQRLLGDYAQDGNDGHGLPPDRTAAFRYGFYIAPNGGIDDLDQAYALFQARDFPAAASGYESIRERCK